MKIRAQSKKVKGKLRWYLAKSYRNDTGESRTKWLVYLGEPPSFQLKKFIARVNKRTVFPISFQATIDSIKRYAIDFRKNKRLNKKQHRDVRLKRRRDLHAAHKAGLPFLRRNNPFAKLSHWNWNLKQALERLEADPNYGPIKNWPEDRKEILRLSLKPFIEFYSKVEAEISRRNQPMTIQPDVSLVCEPNSDKHEGKTDTIEEMLKLLDERETMIIRNRFGLDDGTIKSLAEIGRKYGLTRERIRQIEKRAIQKLRSG